MNAERLDQLREWVGEVFKEIRLRVPSDRGKRDDILAILRDYEAARPLIEAAMKFVDDSRDGLPYHAPLEEAVDAYRAKEGK